MELRGSLKAGPAADCGPLARGLLDASPVQRVPTWFPTTLRAAVQDLQAERRLAMKEPGYT